MENFRIQVVKVVEKKPATAVAPIFSSKDLYSFAQELLRLRLEHCESELDVILKGEYYTTEDCVISADGLHRFSIPTHEFLQKLNGCYGQIDSNAGTRRIAMNTEAIALQVVRAIPLIDSKFIEKFKEELPVEIGAYPAIKVKEAQTLLLTIFSADILYADATNSDAPWAQYFIDLCGE